MSESAQEVLSRFLFWRLGITQASIALGYTDELLTALDAAGLTIVPKVPTEMAVTSTVDDRGAQALYSPQTRAAPKL